MSENNLFKTIPGILKREKLQTNKRLVIFLIFIGIATLIWFLWTLDQEYTTVISHPVEFSGFPEDVVLVNELPEKVHIEVKGGGYAILRHNWDLTKGKLKVDFKRLHPEPLKNPEDLSITLSLNTAKTRLSNQLTNISVNSFVPDSISFHFAKMIRKKVPVIADLDLEIEKQYMIRGGIITIPDSIEISGPSTLLDTVTRIQTAALKLKKVDGNIKRNLALIIPHTKISSTEKRAQVEIPIEQYTEKSLYVPVTGVNVPDSLNLKLFPAEAKITFRVVVSEFENIQAESFSLEADYEQIMDGSLSKLSIQLIHFPDFIENVKFNPETVAFILENK